ncbi:hypothetical protein GCM10027051_10540 [Niabella terrae]
MQGVAVDQAHGFVYFSFTDKLIKMDLEGRLIGSVTGFIGHLGDLDFNEADGRIYGSLEYKNDAIGKGILKTLGKKQNTENGFYIAIFDGSRINRPDMDAEKDDLLRTVYLPEVAKDYEDEYQAAGRTIPHRYGCSGIDGLTFGPAIGHRSKEQQYLYVAYGVYGDTDRTDNDHQVILQYDFRDWKNLEKPLSQEHLHHSGPARPRNKYFVFTGSTNYGIQSLAYDKSSGNFFAAVYKGKKTNYPNYDLFVIDGLGAPYRTRISNGEKKVKVQALSLLQAGLRDPATGIRGWRFPWGATGLCPLGEGLFYISHNEKTPDKQQQSTLYTYKWIGKDKQSFVRPKP